MWAVGLRLAERYEITAPLGAGGMGEVYRARDLVLGREVAVKVLPARLARDLEARARFENEARILAALQHPRVLTVYDFGFSGDQPFLVTEVLEGETLRERLARGPLHWKRALEWGRQIAEGLHAVHERGLVHRDVKPENVFLTGSGQVKVLDFGLAQPHAPAPGSVAAPEGDATDPLVGTVNYMAPELLRAEPVDHRADVFGLGCVLHEMLTGRRVFARDTPVGTLASILSDDPPELVVPGEPLPPGLVEAVLHCLRKQPGERFQSMRDLDFALEMISISSASGALTRPQLPRPRPAAPVRRALIAAGVLAGLALGAYLLRERRAPLDSLAVLPFENATADAELEYLSDGLTESVISSLAARPGLRVMAWNTVRRYRGKAADALSAGREMKVDAVLVGRLAGRAPALRVEAELVDVARGARLWSHNYEGPAAELQRLPERIAAQIAAGLDPQLFPPERKQARPPVDDEAYRLYLMGRHQWNKRTPDSFRKAIGFFQRALDRDASYALGHAGTADAYTLLGAFAALPPGEAMPRARAAAERALELDPQLGEAHASLGLVQLLYDWRFDEAEGSFQRAIASRPGYATAHHWYGELLITQRRDAQALHALQRAHELDPLSQIVLTDIGRAHYHARRFAEAERQFRKVLELDDSFTFAHSMLGFALCEQGRLAEAETQLSFGPPEALQDPRRQVHLARLWALSGQAAKAREVLARLEKLAPAAYLAPFDRAVVHAALGERARALELLEAAFAERSQWMPFLDVDPRLDSLRGEPRFLALRTKVGLPGEPPRP